MIAQWIEAISTALLAFVALSGGGLWVLRQMIEVQIRLHQSSKKYDQTLDTVNNTAMGPAELEAMLTKLGNMIQEADTSKSDK